MRSLKLQKYLYFEEICGAHKNMYISLLIIVCIYLFFRRSQFSKSRRSVFVIHGYLNSMNTDYMIYIKDAILNVVSEKSFQ